MSRNLGYRLPTFVRERDAASIALDVAEMAAAGGFRTVSCGDHVLWGLPMLDPMPLLAAAAARIPTVGLGTDVYLPALRHPLHVLRGLATLAQIAGDRVSFGIGVGGDNPHEFDAVGVDVTQRARRTEAVIDLLRGCQGDVHRVDDVPPPRNAIPGVGAPPPIFIGGMSSAARQRAARVGDGWIAMLLSPGRLRSRIAELTDLRASAGRTHLPFEFVAQLPFRIDHGATAVAAAAQYWREIAGLEFDAIRDRCALGPAATRDAVEALFAAGATTVTLMPMTAGRVDELRHVDGACAVAGDVSGQDESLERTL